MRIYSGCMSEIEQDQWSKTSPVFGDQSQLSVIGFVKDGVTQKKKYAVHCESCSKDPELFSRPIFLSTKTELESGSIPCGCSKKPKWSKDQFFVLCSRKAKSLGFDFIGFMGEWKNQRTNLHMHCAVHGDWFTGTITNLLNHGKTCYKCNSTGNLKPDEEMIASFFASGAFHPDTKFWRSDRKTKQGVKVYWKVSCPICLSVSESFVANLQKGHLPCHCVNDQRQAYINLLKDAGTEIAVKFGVAVNSSRRLYQQQSTCNYTIQQESVWLFDDKFSCLSAERECRESLECGIVLKRDMPDGYTETTWLYNLDKIKQIYEKHGGVPV